jgi:hypothetical protein
VPRSQTGPQGIIGKSHFLTADQRRFSPFSIEQFVQRPFAGTGLVTLIRFVFLDHGFHLPFGHGFTRGFRR